MNPRYEFDRSKVPQAHDQSQEKTNYWLTKGYSVVVHNTFSCRWEMQPYLEAAERHNARVAVLDLFDAGLSDEELSQRGLHSVPVEVISRMRERWEHDWGDANPLAPRKRKKGSHG
jgi:predicted kinase